MSDSGANKPERTNPFVRSWVSNNGAAATVHNPEPNIVYIAAGGLTGGLELIVSYPFDYIKTQLQLARNHDKVHGLNTFKDVVKTTIEKRGVKGLYRGLSVASTLAVPREGIRFGVYEALKSHATDEDGHRNPKIFFLCGLGAGVCEATIATTPMETVKVKLILDQLEDRPKYSGFIINSIFKIMKEEGVRGMYRGLTPTVIKQGTNQGIRFYVVEILKLRYRGGDPSAKIPPLVVGFFGVVGGLSSVIINNPIDVIKTRMQGYDYKNIIDCVKKVSMEEGYSAFYKGMKARLIRVGVDGGFTFMVYDFLVNTLSQMLLEK